MVDTTRIFKDLDVGPERVKELEQQLKEAQKPFREESLADLLQQEEEQKQKQQREKQPVGQTEKQKLLDITNNLKKLILNFQKAFQQVSKADPQNKLGDQLKQILPSIQKIQANPGTKNTRVVAQNIKTVTTTLQMILDQALRNGGEPFKAAFRGADQAGANFTQFAGNLLTIAEEPEMDAGMGVKSELVGEVTAEKVGNIKETQTEQNLEKEKKSEEKSEENAEIQQQSASRRPTPRPMPPGAGSGAHNKEDV